MTDEVPPALGDVGVGSQVASYRLDEQIGWGGMAVVYRALDVRLDRWVALKILAPEIARDGSFRQRFISESRAAAAVDHPHIIPVFEAGEAGGVLFIAMRYVGGGDVRTLFRRLGRLDAARVTSIVTQVAAALDASHAIGLVHRDVKPANMLLGTVGGGGRPDHVYLADFGLSKQALSTAGLTLTGQFVGTLDYMAPEQIEARPVDGRADLYALACAAFEMLSGALPFRRDQDLGRVFAQLSQAPPALTARRPDLPPGGRPGPGPGAGQIAGGPSGQLPGVRGRPAGGMRARMGRGRAASVRPAQGRHRTGRAEQPGWLSGSARWLPGCAGSGRGPGRAVSPAAAAAGPDVRPSRADRRGRRRAAADGGAAGRAGLARAVASGRSGARHRRPGRGRAGGQIPGRGGAGRHRRRSGRPGRSGAGHPAPGHGRPHFPRPYRAAVRPGGPAPSRWSLASWSSPSPPAPSLSCATVTPRHPGQPRCPGQPPARRRRAGPRRPPRRARGARPRR